MCFHQFSPLSLQDEAADTGGIRIHHHLQETENDLWGIKTPILDCKLCSRDAESQFRHPTVQHKPSVMCSVKKMCSETHFNASA